MLYIHIYIYIICRLLYFSILLVCLCIFFSSIFLSLFLVLFRFVLVIFVFNCSLIHSSLADATHKACHHSAATRCTNGTAKKSNGKRERWSLSVPSPTYPLTPLAQGYSRSGTLLSLRRVTPWPIETRMYVEVLQWREVRGGERR